MAEFVIMDVKRRLYYMSTKNGIRKSSHLSHIPHGGIFPGTVTTYATKRTASCVLSRFLKSDRYQVFVERYGPLKLEVAPWSK